MPPFQPYTVKIDISVITIPLELGKNLWSGIQKHCPKWAYIWKIMSRAQMVLQLLKYLISLY